MPNDTEPTPVDTIGFLARATSRVRIMGHLLAVDGATQRELRQELDASRTTVVRALRSLEQRDWVEESSGSYRLTPVGSIIAEAFTDLVETIRTTEELSDFLRWFPSERDAPDFLALTDANVTTSSEGDPYAPARRQAQILRTAEELRFLLPSIDLEATRVLHEQVIERGLVAETVINPGLEATIESAEFAPLIEETVRTGRSTMLVAPTELPFYLGLAGDGRTQIGVEDDEGFPRALLETTDPTVREWAEAVYREYREAARQKPVEDV